MSGWWRRQDETVLLFVRLTPRAGSARIGGRRTDAEGQDWLCASVTAPPDKGKANSALIDLLSRTLSVPSSLISLEAGGTSRLKRLRIDRADDATLARLEGLE